MPDYTQIFDGEQPITKHEFENWHRQTVLEMIIEKPNLSVGWAAKVLNYFLKTTVNIAGFGRPDLIKWIHPLVDNGLWEGIEDAYKDRRDILEKTHYRQKVKDIVTYNDYQTIIEGMEIIAQERGYLLIEVEEFWKERCNEKF
ncbi:hypothetical protein [Runella aurantiaca]|uniref:Uncharacterized protein n=1 Tax=Runella aurantiaca TaxID=2282308 RepID=A0A369I8J2_9BACT|nr:hypothetical protein [Runella aurantiaca]RDB02996.1 hypothetical protein DVG78_25605 [Runella aurantiaca]